MDDTTTPGQPDGYTVRSLQDRLGITEGIARRLMRSVPEGEISRTGQGRQSTRIASRRAISRLLPNVLHDEAPDGPQQTSLRAVIIEAANPPISETAILADAVRGLAGYIAGQPDTCPADDAALAAEGPCKRCAVLGRVRDRRVTR